MTRTHLYFAVYYTEYHLQSLVVDCLGPLFEELKKKGMVRYASFYRSAFQGKNLIVNLEAGMNNKSDTTDLIKQKVFEDVRAFFSKNPVSANNSTGHNPLKLFANRPENTIEFFSDIQGISGAKTEKFEPQEEHLIVADKVSGIALDLFESTSNWGIESSILISVQMKLICGFIYSKREGSKGLISFLENSYEFLISSENQESIEWAKQASAPLFEERKDFLISFVNKKLQAMENGIPMENAAWKKWYMLADELYEFQKSHDQLADKRAVVSLLSFADNLCGVEGPYVHVIYLLLIKTLKSMGNRA